MIYYIADMHFGHDKILQLCNRPFSNIKEHDQFIIEMWNKTVQDNDTVYIIGDVAFKNKVDINGYLKKLKGKKYLLIGNHDSEFLKPSNPNLKHFQSIQQMMSIRDGDKRIVLCHYPLAEWYGYFRGSYHIYGHIHNNNTNSVFDYLRKEERALNAGVDINHFKPVTLNELIKNNEVFKNNSSIQRE